MTELEKRKGGGAKLSRSETVTVRLDPRLRYLAELASLKHRRTLSSFIEWAVEETLKSVVIDDGDPETGEEPTTVAQAGWSLWDVDEADRFAKLALRYPELLTHEEQKRWKLIRENGSLWRGNYQNADNEWKWDVRESNLLFDRLRQHWDSFSAVARGEAPHSPLPSWAKKRPVPMPAAPTPTSAANFEDDDIPF
ncbi:MAG: hypothetical protein QE272_11555 [Nevskia sp.]|nr:hypothetical protein [Nevskia sp.]